jgi:hypothetical protein
LPIDGDDEVELPVYRKILHLLVNGAHGSADEWYSSMHMHDDGTVVFGKGGDPDLRLAIQSLFGIARADFQLVAEVGIFFTTYETTKSAKGRAAEIGWLEAVQSLPATLPALEVRAECTRRLVHDAHDQLARLCSGQKVNPPGPRTRARQSKRF